MGKTFLVFTFILLVFSSNAYAGDKINYKNLDKAGFSEISKLLKDMTPEQRKMVLVKAAELKKELQKMPPEAVEMMKMTALAVTKMIDWSGVQVEKLKPSESKNLQGIKQDMSTFIQNK